MTHDTGPSPDREQTSLGRGIPARGLGDDDLLRELGQLHRTRHETFRHGSDSAFDAHRARTDELEREYLQRFPEREIDPRRLRDGETDDLDEGAGRDDGREERPVRDPGADLDGLGMPDIAEDQVPGAPGGRPDYEPMVGSAPVEAPTGSLEWGTTAREEAAGEPLDQRLAREEPDTIADPEPADATLGDRGRQGQVVQPDEGARPDADKDEVGDLVGDLPEERLSAEESAVRLEREG
jgi:hypothetical protein